MSATRELNRLVDGLGLRLRRNISVDDSRLRQLTYSSHEFGVVDELRGRSILMRDVPAGAAEWTWDSGAKTAEGPFRPPVAPEIGATAQRLCVPIKLQGTLLGFLWVMEGTDPLDDADMHMVQSAIETIAVVMQRDMLADERDHSRASELLRTLVSDENPVTRDSAAQDLVDHDLFVSSEPVVALVVTLHGAGVALRESERNVMAGHLDRVSRRMTPRRSISLVRRDHGLVVMSDKDVLARGHGKRDLAAALIDALARDVPVSLPRVGLGAAVPDLDGLHESYRQARQAARVSRVVTELSPVASFEDLGIYGLLARIPEADLTEEALPAALRRLLSGGVKGERLATTLEVFLDNTGDIQASVDQLFVHRTTLYYRLQRIEKLTGADLANGVDRLQLHLGLKVARLIGLRTDAPASRQ